MGLFLKTYCLGDWTGISIINSTPTRSCHIRWEKQHNIFKNMATREHTSTGCFFGFKLHFILNDKREMLDYMLIQGSVDDRESLKDSNCHKRIFGQLFGDKGYISKDLFEQLFVVGVHLITKIKKNIKNCLILMDYFVDVFINLLWLICFFTNLMRQRNDNHLLLTRYYHDCIIIIIVAMFYSVIGCV